jgi:hypothetical protein
MNGQFSSEAGSSGRYPGGLHESFEWQQEGKPSPQWQAAWRFAAAIRKQGFLPGRHFIDRMAKRAVGEGIRFDPRTFRSEFFGARHYRQTRPGYNTRIAVVRGIPILYLIGGRSGNHIVLAGALPEGGLPPVEPASPPVQREQEEIPDWLRRGVRRIGRTFGIGGGTGSGGGPGGGTGSGGRGSGSGGPYRPVPTGADIIERIRRELARTSAAREQAAQGVRAAEARFRQAREAVERARGYPFSPSLDAAVGEHLDAENALKRAREQHRTAEQNYQKALAEAIGAGVAT